LETDEYLSVNLVGLYKVLFKKVIEFTFSKPNPLRRSWNQAGQSADGAITGVDRCGSPGKRLPCTHISALTPSVPLAQNWARGRPDKAFRLPFSRFGRRGWGMREKPWQQGFQDLCVHRRGKRGLASAPVALCL